MPSIVVVGGTSGIGRAIAEKYAGQGWSVVLTGRDKARAESVAGETGGDTRGLALNLAEPEAAAGALADVSRVDQVKAAFTKLEAAGANPVGMVLNGVPVRQYAYYYGGYGYAAS